MSNIYVCTCVCAYLLLALLTLRGFEMKIRFMFPISISNLLVDSRLLNTHTHTNITHTHTLARTERMHEFQLIRKFHNIDPSVGT